MVIIVFLKKIMFLCGAKFDVTTKIIFLCGVKFGVTTLTSFDWDTLYSMSLTEKQHRNLSIHKCTTYRDVYDCTGINLIPDHFKPNKPPKYM